MRSLPVLCLLATAALCARADGQLVYEFLIDSEQSTAALGASVTTEADGTLRGVYDAVDNPGGTRTIAGLFGDPGTNALIPTSFDTAFNADSTTNPLGGFFLNIDAGALTAEMSGFSLDVLAGAMPTGEISVTLEYSTFRTANPDSVFIGGFPVTLPLGEASIDQFSLVQSGSAAGTLTPTGANTYDITIPATATLTLQVTVLEQAIEPASVDIPIVLVGSLAIDGPTATFDASFEFASDETTDPALPPIEDLPFPAPTILPAGGTADLLLNLTITSLGSATSLNVMLNADGTQITIPPCPADWDGSGTVDSGDFFAFIADFIAGAADYDGSDATDSGDFFAFITGFLNGCA